MYQFDDLNQVQSTLQRLAQREPPVAKILPRQPGTKEARYAQLLSGDPQIDLQNDVKTEAPAAGHNAAPKPTPQATAKQPPPAAPPVQMDGERIARLENELTGLQNEVADLKQQLAAFRKQFE